jgi:peptide/nickel transport system permease protein
MLAYILKRILLITPALLFVSIISFSMVYLAPGDPAEVLMMSPEGSPSPEAIDAFRVRMGLDQPIYVQYLRWLEKVLHGDFGYSYMSERPVADAIMTSFRATLRLSVVSMIVSIVVSIPLGILAAMKPNTIIDDLCRFWALIGVSIPNFWQAFLLILLFSVYLDWLPVAGYGGGDLDHMILPAITLGTSSAAVTTRLMRSSLLEALSQDYIITARAKGLPERVVIGKHALKNALIPVVTMLGLNLGFLLNGAVVTEWIFGWPGIGDLVVDSIYQRDYTVIQGSILFIAVIFVALNLIVDISYTYLNPRIRYEVVD